MSKITVQRRFREYGISASSALSQQTDHQLDDLVRQVKNDFSNAGYLIFNNIIKFLNI